MVFSFQRHLCADHGVKTGLLRRHVKADRPGQAVVIGQRQGRQAKRLGALHQRFGR